MKKRDIDAKDIEILNILQENATLTNKELAKKIELSEGPTLVRVQNLFEKGVIRNYTANPNFGYFGYSHYFYVNIPVLKEKSNVLVPRIQSEGQVISAVHLEVRGAEDVGVNQYSVVISGKNDQDCKEVLDKLLHGHTNSPSIAVTYEIHKALETIKNKPIVLTNKDCR